MQIRHKWGSYMLEVVAWKDLQDEDPGTYPAKQGILVETSGLSLIPHIGTLHPLHPLNI